MATRVTDAEKDRMRELRADGMPYAAIGRKVGRGRSTVRRACDSDVRAKEKAYIESPKGKTYQNTYDQLPERKAKKKAYHQTPEWKAGRKVYEQSLGCKSKRLAWRRKSINYLLGSKLRNRMDQAITCNQKAGSAVRELGCTIDELKAYLELKFKPGMTWDNWSMHGWHIDHIKPLASFDLTDREQFKEACHYTNLQPLWAEENLSKGAKLAWEAA